MQINVLKPGESVSPGCAVFPVSSDANVHLEVTSRIQDAAKEAKKLKAKVEETKREQVHISTLSAGLSSVQNKDVSEALLSVERRKRDVDARFLALQETMAMFEKMQL